MLDDDARRDAAGGDAPVTAVSAGISPLTGAWSRSWQRDPGASALLAPAGGVDLSAGDLSAVTAGAAGVLARAGVGPDDRVLLSAAPSAGTVVAYAAILRLGAVVVPVNTAATPAELAHVLHTAAPVAAVLDDPARADLPVVLTADRLLAQAGDATATTVPLDRAGPDRPAMLGFTSGTTGRPKAAVLTHANLAAGAQAVVRAWEWTAADRLLLTLPLFHMHGLGVGVNGSLAAGASMVVLPGFDPAVVAAAAADLTPTLFFGVPTMYARLVDTGHAAALAGLRLLVSGSAPMSPTLFEAVRRATGQAPLERYGMTETVILTSNPVHGQRRPGSVGRPLPGVDLRLDPVTAEVQVRGPSVFAGYLDRPRADAQAFTDDGWFRTGDVGRLDGDGYLSLVGRTRELVITGGYNVYPREVEDCLMECRGVVEAAVVGRPDPTWGETVVAFVVVDGPVEVADLERHVAERLSAYKRPRAWHVLEDLPRNAMGKVRRDVLAALAGTSAGWAGTSAG